MEIATALTTVDISYANGVNSIEPSLAQKVRPLHLFDCFCSKSKSVSCALACCIGTTTTAAESIATAASTATITNVELFIYLLLNFCTQDISTLKKIIPNCHYRNNYNNVITKRCN
jgi:hypothetical protein